ncbi:unnamed protein product [Schistosoma curassoni]|uniref:Uncharacterized protein n=1 Tax=Schistosoma curassoni TaxID=6186 RepID=A0A183KU96_9TREM|nr:unnamed protein product [Schistosoma curassoni]
MLNMFNHSGLHYILVLNNLAVQLDLEKSKCMGGATRY